MPLNLPSPLPEFFAAMNGKDAEGLKRVFAADALVHDEDEDHRGHAAIAAWAEEKAFQYDVMVVPVRLAPNGAATLVECRVDGAFDKSGLPDPLILAYHFGVTDGKIASLSIDFPE